MNIPIKIGSKVLHADFQDTGVVFELSDDGQEVTVEFADSVITDEVANFEVVSSPGQDEEDDEPFIDVDFVCDGDNEEFDEESED
jgi:hypothetical protein